MTAPSPEFNTSLAHVPANIQAELTTAVTLIHQTCKKDVAMIWLFGSYARGDFINDRRVDENGAVSEYNSDVDVLVVLRGKESGKKSNLHKKFIGLIEDSPELTSTFHVIYETLDNLNKSLNRSEYFYLDVVNEGVVLFEDNVKLAQPQQLSPAQRRDISIGYFERFYQKAVESQQTFEYLYQKGALSGAIFSLHQMTERLFSLYLLVTTHYKPRTHKLYELRSRVATLAPEIKTIFPGDAKEDRKHFAFLGDSYIDSRYKPNYDVPLEVLDTLTQWVANFQQWVYQKSLNTIDGFIPEQNYSDSQTLPYRFLDLETLKSTPLPEVLVLKQEEELKQEVLRREQAETEKELERKEKEAAQKQLEEALKKLRDAGLE